MGHGSVGQFIYMHFLYIAERGTFYTRNKIRGTRAPSAHPPPADGASVSEQQVHGHAQGGARAEQDTSAQSSTSQGGPASPHLTEAQQIQAALFTVGGSHAHVQRESAPGKPSDADTTVVQKSASGRSQAPDHSQHTAHTHTNQPKPEHPQGASDGPHTDRAPREYTSEDQPHANAQRQPSMDGNLSPPVSRAPNQVTPRSVRARHSSVSYLSSWLSCPVPTAGQMNVEEPVNFVPLESFHFEDTSSFSLQQVELAVLSSDEDRSYIGQWGEMWVYNYLCIKHAASIAAGNVRIIWLNQRCQSEAPFDIRFEQKQVQAVIIDGNPVEEESWLKTCIEVKATKAEEKNMFEISRQEVQAAVNLGERYHIYRVYNAGGDGSRVKLRILPDIVTLMDTNAIKLCLFI